MSRACSFPGTLGRRSPEEDRVHVVAQVAERRFRERLARREIMIGAVGEALEIQPESVLGGGFSIGPSAAAITSGPIPSPGITAMR